MRNNLWMRVSAAGSSASNGKSFETRSDWTSTYAYNQTWVGSVGGLFNSKRQAATPADMPGARLRQQTTAPPTAAAKCWDSSTYRSARPIPSQARGITCVSACSTTGYLALQTAAPATMTVSGAPPATTTRCFAFFWFECEVANHEISNSRRLLFLARVAAAESVR